MGFSLKIDSVKTLRKVKPQALFLAPAVQDLKQNGPENNVQM
jgi:hypothetical protein